MSFTVEREQQIKINNISCTIQYEGWFWYVYRNDNWKMVGVGTNKEDAITDAKTSL